MRRMDDTTRASLLALHRLEHESAADETWSRNGRCMTCRGSWPCDTALIVSEMAELVDALRYCLMGVEIIGCPSPGLLEDTLDRLEQLAGIEAESGEAHGMG